MTGSGSRPLVVSCSMRDHHKLKAFGLADDLAVAVYQITNRFPKQEQFGLVVQMRRAAVSIPCNIVEGCARNTEAEFLRFLDMAYGSARELEYQLSLAERLGYVPSDQWSGIQEHCLKTCKVLNGLIRALRRTPTP